MSSSMSPTEEHFHAQTIESLRTARPECVLQRGTFEYEEARKGFWAADQARCTPYCIFQPLSASDVADAVRILRKTACPFGIKSGGHGRCEGESSITEGVLIDLKRLNHIELCRDKNTCRVGPGNVWKDVYELLNPQGLTVIGGRASTVGVGGFCISGGISFFSNRYGWALDNVVSFEVVLADGSIIRANDSFYNDLYKALRGGGANFGIVTELELSVYPYEGMWGGGISWTWDHGDALIDAFIEYGNNNVGNKDASVILGAINHAGQWIWHADIEHLKPTPPDERSVLRRFLDIPAAGNLPGPTSQLERTDSITSHYPPGSFNGYWTFCTQVDKRIIKFFMETWRAEIDPLLNIDGIDRAALADINFVSQNIIDAMTKSGGNTLGLADKGPFLLFLMEPYWTQAAESPRIWRALQSTARITQAEAVSLGLQHSYIYLNYANPFQDVYSGYGPDAKQFLNAVSTKYDPEGMFQTQRRAGWHLNGPLVESQSFKLQETEEIVA